MKVKGTVTPEIATKVSGYDFDIRTVRNEVNLHISNSHVTTDLLCYKLGHGKFEVEAVDDPLHLFREGLEEGDVMTTDEIANVMIRQALKGNDMRISSSSEKKKRKNYNVTGMEDGDLVNPNVPSGDAAIACSFGTFVSLDGDIEGIVSSMNPLMVSNSDSIVYLGEYAFIPSAYIAQMLDKDRDAIFYQVLNIIRTVRGDETLKEVSHKAFDIDKNTGVVDLDILFDTPMGDFGKLQYSALDHSWSWVKNDGLRLDRLSKGEILSIFKYIPQFVSKAKSNRGESGNREYLGADSLMTLLKKKRSA